MVMSMGAAGALNRAAEIIRAGGVVAVPTETFYGLAADFRNGSATARIFEIKGRPDSMQLPLVAASTGQVEQVLGALDARSAKAAARFWPGPLSLVLSLESDLSVTAAQTGNGLPVAGNRTLAVRVPGHDFVRHLCDRAGTLLTATSANKTGEPPAQTAEAVVASLGSLVDLVIDGGTTAGGKPSTIADLRSGPPRLIRDGAIRWTDVLEALSK